METSGKGGQSCVFTCFQNDDASFNASPISFSKGMIGECSSAGAMHDGAKR